MRKALLIAGPTGLGKGALARAMQKELGAAELVSCDSAKVWRGLDAGTNKTKETVGKPHMIDVAELGGEFSAGEYARLAGHAIQGIYERARVPVVYGGSGMYFDWLMNGVGAMPPTSSDKLDPVTEELRSLRNFDAVRARLEDAGDARAAEELKENDYYRAAKQILWVETHGKTVAQLRAESPGHPAVLEGVDVRAFFTYPRSRVDLFRRLDWRCERMIGNLLLEVDWFLDVRPEAMTATPARSVGYRQAIEFLSLPEEYQTVRAFRQTLKDFQTASRGLARRQLTWFKHPRRVSQFCWIPFDSTQAMVEHTKRLYDMERAEFEEVRRSEQPPASEFKNESLRTYTPKLKHYASDEAIMEDLSRISFHRQERRSAKH